MQVNTSKLRQKVQASSRSSLGKRVRQLRLATGKSLNIFCFENDILKAALSGIENGVNANPKLNQLRKIAGGLGLTVAELLTGVC